MTLKEQFEKRKERFYIRARASDNEARRFELQPHDFITAVNNSSEPRHEEAMDILNNLNPRWLPYVGP